MMLSAPARIITVSSAVHQSGVVNLNDLQSERGYVPRQVYANTKLMNVLFTNELARRIADSGVTANSLHPGVINTTLYQAYMGRQGTPDDLDDWRMGAETSIFVASDPGLEGTSGRYFSVGRQASASKQARDEILAGDLWAASAALCGLDEHTR